MGIHRGPNMEKGGLVFGYDTGHGVCDNHTSSRFYQGKPTTNTWNKNTHSYTSGNITATRNAIPPVPPPLEVQGFEVYKLQSNDGGLNQGIMGTSNVVDGVGGNYVHSVYCFLESGTIVTVGQHWHPWAYGDIQNPPLGRWVRLSQTVTNAVDNYGNVANAYRTNGVAYFTAPQYELGSVVTPHVDGTRSSTESLIDLKRTSKIDVSNVSFDSTGQPSFDGTDDVISINVDEIVRRSNDITIDGIVEIPSGAGLSGGPWSILTDHSVAGDKDGFWWHMNLSSQVYFRVEDNVSGEQGVTFSGGTPFVGGNTYHITTVVGSSGVFLYVNGELSKTYNPSFNWANISSSQTAYLNIGHTYPNYYLNSKNRVVRMYGRGLTADEIKQNYNVYKKRFSI